MAFIKLPDQPELRVSEIKTLKQRFQQRNML